MSWTFQTEAEPLVPIQFWCGVGCESPPHNNTLFGWWRHISHSIFRVTVKVGYWAQLAIFLFSWLGEMTENGITLERKKQRWEENGQESSQEWVVWVLEFPPCEELKPGRARAGEELKMRATERACRHWAASLSLSNSHQPFRRLSPRIHPIPPPNPLFHSPASAPIVSQSASSGACDVTVQSDFVWANQGMLLSPKKRESAGLIQTRPERDRQMLWWEGKHEITDGERYMDRERETVRQSSRNVRRVNEFVRVKNRTKVLAYRPWER